MSATNEIDVNQDVKDLIGEIIAKEKLSGDAKVTYDVGFNEGDGYLSRSIAVTISDDEQKKLDIFIKCALNIQSSAMLPVDKFYANEIYFYDKICPAYTEFLREKGIEDGFRNVPKCYGTSTKKIIALENLKVKGYGLCDKTKPLNEKYIALVFKTFAKVHAIAYAFKDQKPKQYEELIAPTQKPVEEVTNDYLEQQAKDSINDFLASLDPVKDKHLLDGTVGLAERLLKYGAKNFTAPEKTDYDILTQGDCWCNNMMFLFEDNDKTKPTDIILLDWQLIKTCIPVYDLAYFFYTSASEEAMRNINKHLKLYHDELSRQIRKLGSDPDVLYPFWVFKRHWRDNAKFGFYMGFMLIRIVLCEQGEYLNLENTNFDSLEGTDKFFSKIKNNDEYYRRMKIITEHMVSNRYLNF